MRYLFFLIIVLGSSIVVEAQLETIEGLNPDGTNKGLDSMITRELPDTSYFDYYMIDNIDDVKIYSDTILTNVHQFDSSRRRDIDYFTTGNTGSSAMPIAYTPRTKSGFDLGFHQYDLYRIDESNFKFYKLNRPLNDLFFSPSQGQSSFMVKAKFAREFSDGISLSMDYFRVKETGFYNNQATKITSFGAGIAYQSPNNKYRLFVNLYNNNASEQFNGGITTDTLFGTEFYESLVNIPVYSKDATIRKADRSFVANQFYTLQKTEQWNLKLKHKIEINSSNYLFSDKIVSTSTDSILYGQFLTENRGIRTTLDHSFIYNYAGVSLSNKQFLNIEMGMDYKKINLSSDSKSNQLNSVFLRSRLNTLFYNIVGFEGNLSLGLVDYAGDFDLDGKVYIQRGDMNISGGIHLYRYTPSENQKYLEINAVPFWNKALEKTFGTKIYGQLSIPKTKTRLDISQSVENQLVYYNQDGQVAQYSNNISSTTMALTQGFRLWKFNYQGTVQYQVFSEDLYGLPPLFAKQSFYFESRVFKRLMQLQVGLDHRYIEYNQNLNYSPITGALYPTGLQKAEYQLVDAFLNFKISSLSVFVKQENIINLINGKVNYLIPGYPDNAARIRFGLRWFLMD